MLGFEFLLQPFESPANSLAESSTRSVLAFLRLLPLLGLNLFCFCFIFLQRIREKSLFDIIIILSVTLIDLGYSFCTVLRDLFGRLHLVWLRELVNSISTDAFITFSIWVLDGRCSLKFIDVGRLLVGQSALILGFCGLSLQMNSFR